MIDEARQELTRERKLVNIDRLMTNLKTKTLFQQFADVPEYKFSIVLIPVMFSYLTIVSKSGEITVKCRTLAQAFPDPEFVSLFAFFEIELFAFGGILLGLWLWLTLKFWTNQLFQDGPKFTFKTDSVRFADDLLIRNQKDAFIFTGVIWSCSINAYLGPWGGILGENMTILEKIFLQVLF